MAVSSQYCTVDDLLKGPIFKELWGVWSVVLEIVGRRGCYTMGGRLAWQAFHVIHFVWMAGIVPKARCKSGKIGSALVAI
jgi:hypothetical protein